jgi:hypothetical protein
MRSFAVFGALAVFAATPAIAQGKFRTDEIDQVRRIPTTVGGQVLGGVLGQDVERQERKSSDKIPPGHLPPRGMCRVWIEGVPPGHQPAPTDCQTAVATKPANARVIWGDQSAFPGKGKGKFDKRDRDDDDDIRDRGRQSGGIFGTAIPTQQNVDAKGKNKSKGKGKGGK